jgi:predicted nucleic acid-binding protein
VVDASALAALTFAEPAAAQVVAQLGDDDLVAPTLLWHEMANVCLTKMRIHPSERERLLAALHMAARLDLHVVDVDHAAAIELAEATGLTAYDAAYLWLARHLGAPLVTLDRKLAAAWQG